MPPIVRATIVFGITSLLVASVTEAQTRSRLRRGLSPAEREETNRLVAMVDALEGGELPGGDAWLKWSGHFLRAPGGRTYAPFTVAIDEAPQGFESVGLYVRAVRRTADESRSSRAPTVARFPGITYGTPDDVTGRAVREAQEVAMATRRKPGLPRRRKYDAVWFIETDRTDDLAPRLARASLTIPPGDYDIYVAVRDFQEQATGSPVVRQASIVRRLTIPDFSGTELSTSSIIVADHVEPLDRELSRAEQAERPYAFGGAELTPNVIPEFTASDNLSLMFFVYNLLAGEAGHPDAAIEYHFFRVGIVEKLFVVTEPQVFSAETLSPGTVLDPEFPELPVSAEIPLTRFTPGAYRLQVTLTDNFAATSIVREVEFSVVDAQTSQR